MFSNHIQLILFLFSGGEEDEQRGEVQQRSKSPASDCIVELNDNIVELNVFLFYTREEDGFTRRRTRREMRRGRRGLRRGTRKRKKRKEKRTEKRMKRKKKYK